MISRDVSVAEAMSEDVRVALPEMAIREAARMMAEIDVGVLPVSDDGKLIGMLTDRDIAIRAIALGLGPDTEVRDVMSHGARYCHAEDRLDKVLKGMGALQVRRMPVLDRDERLVGMISLADASAAMMPGTAEALSNISEPGDEPAPDADRSSDDSIGNLLHFTDDEAT